MMLCFGVGTELGVDVGFFMLKHGSCGHKETDSGGEQTGFPLMGGVVVDGGEMEAEDGALLELG